MRRERRKNFRVEWNSPARIYHDELVRPCVLVNLSNGGARVTGVRPETFPEEFMLRVTPHGRIHKCRVLWRTDDSLGVRFTDYIPGGGAPNVANTAREPAYSRHQAEVPDDEPDSDR